MTGPSQDMIHDWAGLRTLALSLDLPGVTEAISWGNPNLKAHGKMWCWWSPLIDAAVFKGSIEEREALHEADPLTFPLHPHYRNYGAILVAGGRLHSDWAKARLARSWREMAPKRFLRDWDAGRTP